MPVVLDAAGELLIGRGPECGLRLNERNVSRKHAKLVLKDGAWSIFDLGAYNGVVVNGTRVAGSHPVVLGDAMRIGDFQLELRAADTMGHEITKPTLLIGNDEGTEPEGEERALARQLAEEPTTPGPTALPPLPAEPAVPVEAQGAEAVPPPRPVQLGEEPTEILPRNEEATKPAPLAPPFAQLLCVMGEQAGRTYAIDRAAMVIGRTQDNDIVIDHRSMSRHHAKVVVQQGRYRILDLDSANGLLVNDEAYTETELKHGDLAELGHVKLRFVAPGEPAVLTIDEREQVQAQKRPKAARPKHGRVPWFAAIVLGFAIVASYAYLARSPDANAPVAAAPQSDKDEKQQLLMQARQAIALRNYPRAEALAGAVLELEPSLEEARQILSQCDLEQKGHEALEQATGAAGREDWAAAFEALKNVPKASSVSSRAATLLEQVRPALVTARVDNVKRALQAERLDDADRELSALEDLQVGTAQVAELHSAIEEAKKARLARSTSGDGDASAAGRHAAGSPAASAPSSSSHSSGHSGSSDEPRQLYADGTRALSQGKNQAAVDALLRCVAQDKTFARCYRALGIAYAKMGNGPKAVRYYRQYLKVDPQAKDASSVKQLLQQYESGQEHSGSAAPAVP
jgi:pSer/pThr/pTyr-binding forkhead associated (FHA) protein